MFRDYLPPSLPIPANVRDSMTAISKPPTPTLTVGEDSPLPGIGTDERSRKRFRSGLYAAARLDRVSVRGQPDGSVRVTRVGVW